jgi:hypothetical protein
MIPFLVYITTRYGCMHFYGGAAPAIMTFQKNQADTIKTAPPAIIALKDVRML